MLDIKELLQKQKELDEVIFKNAGLKEYPLEDVKLALLVELAELANEVKCFKYWKRHKEINRERVLDEFADCLHFALSLQNHLQQKPIDMHNVEVSVGFYKEKVKKGSKFNLTESFLTAKKNIIKEDRILLNIIVLGSILYITFEEMEQAYLTKNKVNYERQNNGY